MRRRILYIQFADAAAYPPIQHSSRILAERGWDVILLGTDAFSGAVWTNSDRDVRIRRKNLALANTGGWHQLQYVVFAFWCLCWACFWRPSWIYVSDPLALPAAWLLRTFTRRRVVYHEHDSPVASQNPSWFMKAVLASRKKVGNQVELCVFPQQERLAAFLETTGRVKPSICVWNCPRLGEVLTNNRVEESPSSGSLIVYYHGSVNRERLPEALVVAASRFNGRVIVRIAGYEVPGSMGYIGELIKLAADNGAPGIVEHLGIITIREELIRSAAKADVGLSLMPKDSTDINLRYMLGASNKSFEYMACGVPLLVTDLPDWKSTFVTPGYARACDPEGVDSIAAELTWYLNHPDERRRMGLKCAEQIRTSWNYDALFSEVVSLLEK